MIKTSHLLGTLLIILGVFLPSRYFIIEKKEIKENGKLVEEAKTSGDYFALLEIEKIGLERLIYPAQDERNHVDQNVFLHPDSLLPNDNKSYVILAAHSGNGINAYFKDLYQLEIGDQVSFTYQDQKWVYEIKEIEYQEKTGTLYLKKDEEQMLILITCTKDNSTLQTVYYAALKDS